MAFRDNSLFLMKNMQATHMRAYQGKLLFKTIAPLHRRIRGSDVFALHCFTQTPYGNEATCEVLENNSFKEL